MKRLVSLVVVLFGIVGCSKSTNGSAPDSPTAPTAPTQTRVMALEGDLDFGDVQVGQSADKVSGALQKSGEAKFRCRL
jgi:hypothetical protein